MLIVNNRIIPFGKSYIAINLFGVVFAKEKLSREIIRHERIHTAQQRELLFVGFFLLYLMEWGIRLIACRDMHKAYRSISFEQEAYCNQHTEDYVLRRRHYSWLRYLCF